MKKRDLLLGITGTIYAGGMAYAQTNPAPNVILIVADDLGYGDLSCYGAKRVSTPNVDKLASRGVLFTDAHAVASTSTPSRYSILTGEYAWKKKGTDIAQGNAGMIIRPEMFTLADLFKSKGYATAAIGKWHLGLGDKTGEQDWNAPLPMALSDIGFDYSYIMAATGDRVPCVFIENGQVANWDENAPIQVSYKKNFEGEPTGKSNPELLKKLKPSPNHGHDQSIVNGISRIGFMKGGGKALWRDEDIADSITSHAISFINKNKNDAFFMYLCTNDVHVPRYPHERFRGKNQMGLRGEAIMQFDWTIGKVMETLEEQGLMDNTLIILTSDNGPVLDDGYADNAIELAGNHKPGGKWRGGKYSTYEAGTRVPFIVAWKGQTKEGSKSDALISQIDYFASLNSILGVKLPYDTAQDSEDNLSTWLGKDQKDRDLVIEQSVNHTLSIRKGQWKYIEPSNGSPVAWQTGIETGYKPQSQLYNLRKDPSEKKNIAEEEAEQTKVMQELLTKAKGTN